MRYLIISIMNGKQLKNKEVNMRYRILTGINDPDIHYVGEFEANYSTLCKHFGKPQPGSADGKTDAIWYLEFENGLKATIYNWKNGKSYLGKAGLDLENIKEWNVGAIDRIVVDYIREMLEVSPI